VTHGDFAETYADALNAYVRRPGEEGLYAGYQLGRRALDERIGLLDLLTIHHQALESLFARVDVPVAEGLVLAARFVSQSLASFEMIQRAADEAVQAVAHETRHAELVRRLSALLADASLAHDDGTSLREMLALVAEQARELCEADCCTIVLDGRPPLLASDPPSDRLPARATEQHQTALTALDGAPVGMMTVQRASPPFGARELDVLTQVSQMLAAALERHRTYPR
jgi:prophage DNA circulation protein